MPRPPVIQIVDWKNAFEAAKPYDVWLAEGEIQKNLDSMEQQRKELQLEPTVVAWLSKVQRTVQVFAFAEDWCGDVVRHVPVLQRVAEVCPKLHVRYASRAAFPEIFVRFLTNGGEAVPKFVFLNEAFVECGNWGPMPLVCRELISRGKAAGDVGAARQKVSRQYEMDADKRFVIAELMALIETASCVKP